jgi:hypothetical protein
MVLQVMNYLLYFMNDAYFMNYGAPGHELLAIFHELWCSSSCYICSTEMVLQVMNYLLYFMNYGAPVLATFAVQKWCSSSYKLRRP